MCLCPEAILIIVWIIFIFSEIYRNKLKRRISNEGHLHNHNAIRVSYEIQQTWALAVLPPVSHKFGESCVLYVFHEIAFYSLKCQLRMQNKSLVTTWIAYALVQLNKCSQFQLFLKNSRQIKIDCLSFINWRSFQSMCYKSPRPK